MSVFSAAVDLIFADQNMAADALWQSGGSGPGTCVRVIRKAPDDIRDFGSARISSDTTMIDVRVSEIPTPKAGDRIMIGSEAYLVQGTPQRDRERLVWSVDTRPVP